MGFPDVPSLWLLVPKVPLGRGSILCYLSHQFLEEPTFVHGLEDGWSAGAMPLLLTHVYHICSWPGKSTYVSRDLSLIGSRSCSCFQSAWIAPDLRRRNPGSHAPHARSKAWVCPVLDLPKAEGPGRTSLQMRTEYKSVFWETQTERGWYSSKYWADCYGGLWVNSNLCAYELVVWSYQGWLTGCSGMTSDHDLLLLLSNVHCNSEF